MQEASGSLADHVHRAAASTPTRVALVWHDQEITWAELDARVQVAADRLGALVTVDGGPPGPGHPPRVAIALPNTPQFATTLLGALRAGLVAVPLNPGYTAPELLHVLADSAASVLVGTEEVRAHVRGLADQLPDLVVVPPELPDARTGPDAPATAPDQLAVLLYTSGTEGQPKGAMLTHRALLANHAQLARIEPPVIGADDVVLLALPLFHAYGLNAGLGAVVYHGARGVLVERFDPAGSLDLVARHHVTVAVGVPSMFVGWSLLPELGESMASVRVAVCGAAPIEQSTAQRFTRATRHPVFVGYGLTEAAPVLTSTLASPLPKPGSIGQPIPGVELRLVGADGYELWRDGVEAAADDEDELDLELAGSGTDPGEIVVRGENLFSGYWPDGRGGPDDDGWWATGDIAYADGDGELFLVDRIGELILVNGFNVYPAEVERVLDAHPGIAEAAVVGVPHPYTGQTVRAYLVRAPEGAVTAEDVLRHCERNLARFKCPTSVEFVTELPHSAIGKVRKTLLGRQATDE
ncbi:MAG TPA: AMP-binding protein [Catenuloplanes sp.]